MSNVLYIDIVNDIKSKIKNGVYKPGDMLQPEYEFSEYYGVSRTTLRKSLALLVNEGYVYTIPGKGNYVCKPAAKAYELEFDEIESLNVQIDDVELLDVKVISTNKKLMEKLYIGSNDKVVRIRKIYKSKDTTVEYGIIYVPYHKGNPIVEDIIKFANFYGVMEDKKLHFQVNKKLSIHITKADPDLSKIFNIPQKEPLLFISQEIFNTDRSNYMIYNEFYILSHVIDIQAQAIL